ncbi:hypothetical protein F5884DRAFT_382553 [Xylogone sp. PMI_703]|nr:hypothetical protein F5884DRAFT_382553 [Xylogone sp. PMI_703]
MSAKWMRAASEDRELLQSIIFASDTHQKLLHGFVLDDDPDRYQWQVDVYCRIRREATAVRDVLSDKMIMMILQLASNDVCVTWHNEPEYGLFTPPLTDLQWLSIYGRMKPADSHWRFLCFLIQQRGGIAGLEMNGLAKILSYVDIIYATLTMSTPILSFSEAPIRETVFYVQDSLYALSTDLSKSLSQLRNHGADAQLVELSLDMRRYQTRLEQFSYRRPSQAESLSIAVERNRIQHRLLSLPARDSTTKAGLLSELFRLCTLLYTIMVTFPIPQNHHLRQALVRSIADLMASSEWNRFAHSCPGFLMWCVVMAGTCAFDTEERSFFVDRAACLCVLHKWSEWKDVELLLSDFLWLNSACNKAGIHLWTEVNQYIGGT